jgi:hypothetical protein
MNKFDDINDRFASLGTGLTQQRKFRDRWCTLLLIALQTFFMKFFSLMIDVGRRSRTLYVDVSVLYMFQYTKKNKLNLRMHDHIICRAAQQDSIINLYIVHVQFTRTYMYHECHETNNAQCKDYITLIRADLYTRSQLT